MLVCLCLGERMRMVIVIAVVILEMFKEGLENGAKFSGQILVPFPVLNHGFPH